MRRVFLETASDISSSATLISQHRRLRSTTSTSCADLILAKSSRLRPQTAHGASRPSVQYRESRFLTVPKKRTRTLQIRGLSRKGPLPSSHVLALGSVPRPPAKSPSDFAPDVTDDDITPEPSRKKRMVGSSLARGTTNNRPEPESFDDFIPRQPPAGYNNRTVLIGKQVGTTSEVLWDLRRYCQSLFSNRSNGPYFSLVDQSNIAHVPVTP